MTQACKNSQLFTDMKLGTGSIISSRHKKNLVVHYILRNYKEKFDYYNNTLLILCICIIIYYCYSKCDRWLFTGYDGEEGNNKPFWLLTSNYLLISLLNKLFFHFSLYMTQVLLATSYLFISILPKFYFIKLIHVHSRNF